MPETGDQILFSYEVQDLAGRCLVLRQLEQRKRWERRTLSPLSTAICHPRGGNDRRLLQQKQEQ